MTQQPHSTNGPLSTILVTGGTGKTGRRVARLLEDRGLPVRIGSRSAAERPFDWEDPGTWGPALDGVGAVYLAYAPDLGFPGAAETVGAFAKAAVATGARRLVLLSGRGEEGAVAGEEAVKAAGGDWTVLRAAWFHQNFDESFFHGPVLAGELALPFAGALEPFVDAGDIAEAAVAALTDDRHTGRTYELTGPRLLGFEDVARELTSALGRSVAFRWVSHDAYRAELAAQQLPVELADLFALVLDGRNARLGNDLPEILGRPARDFADYARDAAAAGAWRH
ncbi:NmrA family transcriptional regulator [Streptomyces sp. NPDC089919]|uniref:SDR family oxidoreductase n=1 Tax=Streptomyces sp. NPDC089919 TaxID=3155188 RepID=UPI00341F8A52